MVVQTSRQPLLCVGQDFGLNAGTLQRINESGHFVGRDPPVQRKPVQPRHLAPHSGERIQRDCITGELHLGFWLVVNDILRGQSGKPK